MAVVRRRWLMRGLLLAGVLAAVFTLMCVVRLIADAGRCSRAACPDSAPLLLDSTLNVLQGMSMLVVIAIASWALRKGDHRRLDAAQGNVMTIPLERELRTGPSTELTLPVTLRLRLAWRTKLMSASFGGVFVLTEVVYGITLLSERGDPFITSSVLLGAQGFLLGTLLFIFGLMWFAALERVVATEDGLRVRRFGVRRRIRWSEARLFAKVKPAEYELSGPRAIVRWTRPVDASSYDTVIPFEEYERQMDGLLLLIAERSGLPLADLREPQR